METLFHERHQVSASAVKNSFSLKAVIWGWPNGKLLARFVPESLYSQWDPEGAPDGWEPLRVAFRWGPQTLWPMGDFWCGGVHTARLVLSV